MKTFFHHLQNELVYIPALGIGHYPVIRERMRYDADYFRRYQQMAQSSLERALTRARCELVARHYQGNLVDVGIGSGQFVDARPDTCGYDINPEAIRWLEQRNLWVDLYECDYAALTFWDSLQHIDLPDLAVAQASKWVFVSLPVFTSGEAIPDSRHYQPDEHVFYFTHQGLLRWFSEQGFQCMEHTTSESEPGRSDIGSYAFRRISR